MVPNLPLMTRIRRWLAGMFFETAAKLDSSYDVWIDSATPRKKTVNVRRDKALATLVPTVDDAVGLMVTNRGRLEFTAPPEPPPAEERPPKPPKPPKDREYA